MQVNYHGVVFDVEDGVIQGVAAYPAMRNAVLLDDGRIEVEIQHPEFGWIPFTADADDTELHSRYIHAKLKEELT